MKEGWVIVMNWFIELDIKIQAAIISGIVALITSLFSIPLRHFFERIFLKYKLKSEFEFKQKKQVGDLVSCYVSRLVEAATILNYRLWNLYRNTNKDWLNCRRPDLDGYYFKTTIYRFISVCTIANQFSKEALYWDSRIANNKDVLFIFYTKALLWVLTDVDLFKGQSIEYDTSTDSDHFYFDDLRLICDGLWKVDSTKDNAKEGIISASEFYKLLPDPKNENLPIEKICKFWDGLKKNENRYRWDRIICFDLLLMAFINIYGYKQQKSTQEDFNKVAGQINNFDILKNLERWLPKLGLTQSKYFNTENIDEVTKITESIRYLEEQKEQ